LHDKGGVALIWVKVFYPVRAVGTAKGPVDLLRMERA
jgi:hypothetical protein